MNTQPPQKPSGKPKSFSCPNCGGTITVKALGHSISAVCEYCSSVIDVANENYRVIATANQKTRDTLLAIGSRGAIAGTLWEVIGYMEKADGTGVYRWDEYLLYNPYQGFRFLMQANGHWNFIKVLKKAIVGAGSAKALMLKGQKYTQFLKGWAVVTYVKGEFYWRAQKGERVKVSDYIAPPYLLSVDQNDEEINLALGKYVESEVIAKAFKPSASMPYTMGVAPNQPGPYANAGKIWLTAAIACLFATVMQIAAVVAADNVAVYENNWTIPASDKDKTLSSASFALPKQSNVQVASVAALSNDWLELELTLVNEQTNADYTAGQALEYYSGFDSDGAWSEGNQNTDSFFSGVPGGQYRLLIDADAGAFQKGEPVNFAVKVNRDVPSWSNYWLTLLLIISYPCFVTYRKASFEKQRWAESDFGEDSWDPQHPLSNFFRKGLNLLQQV